MSFSMNIHPRGKWQRVEASLWGKEGGDCLNLSLTDEDNQCVILSIHYDGEKKGAAYLLMMLRVALAALPKTERCTCKIDCDEILMGAIDHDK